MRSPTPLSQTASSITASAPLGPQVTLAPTGPPMNGS